MDDVPTGSGMLTNGLQKLLAQNNVIMMGGGGGLPAGGLGPQIHISSSGGPLTMTPAQAALRSFYYAYQSNPQANDAFLTAAQQYIQSAQGQNAYGQLSATSWTDLALSGWNSVPSNLANIPLSPELVTAATNLSIANNSHGHSIFVGADLNVALAILGFGLAAGIIFGPPNLPNTSNLGLAAICTLGGGLTVQPPSTLAPQFPEGAPLSATLGLLVGWSSPPMPALPPVTVFFLGVVDGYGCEIVLLCNEATESIVGVLVGLNFGIQGGGWGAANVTVHTSN